MPPRHPAAAATPPRRSRPPPLPWLDHAGRFSPLKLSVLLGLLAPALLLGLAWAGGALASVPAKEAVKEIGLWAIRFLFLSLAVTPLRRIARWPRIVLVRRMLGVGAALYAALHLGLYALDKAWRLRVIVAEIAGHFYLAIGFATLLGLGLLAATSTDGWVRRLGARRWQRLHRLVYALAVVAALHFFLQAGANKTEPVMMAGLLGWLLGYRLLDRLRPDPRAGALLALTAAAATLTALGEAAWYHFGTSLNARLVLAANLDPWGMPRPSWWVAGGGLALALLALLRRR